MAVSPSGGGTTNPAVGTHTFRCDASIVLDQLHLTDTNTDSFQITANADSVLVPLEDDPNPLNNEDENQVTVIVTNNNDVDGDTVSDEDPVDGIDNDGDTKVDEDVPELTPPSDCHQQTKVLVVGPQWSP
jgi:hypothetical protein